MAEKRVIIIGAGVAGLSTGCYAQMNGYRTHIFEQHTRPGGLCTAWQRKGFTIDGSIHGLAGARPGSAPYRMYQEIGALAGLRLLPRDHWGYYVHEASGKSIDITADLDRLEADLRALAPEDGQVVEQLLAGIHALRGADVAVGKAPERLGPLGRLKAAWAARSSPRHLSGPQGTLGDLAQEARSPFLRWLLPALMPEQAPLAELQRALAALADGGLATIEGGSLYFARAIERRYRALRGELTCGAAVEEILVQDGQATGVRLADGSIHRADYVVSAADGRATLFTMLHGRYLDASVRERYDAWPLAEPLLFVSFGVGHTLPGRPRQGVIGLRHPFRIGEQKVRHIRFRLSSHDPTLAPAGKTVVQALIAADYDYWHGLCEDRAAYEAEKARLADEVLDRLETHLPGIWTRVEMTDVATPCTLERFTRHYRAAYDGWMVTPQTARAQPSHTLPGLDGLYMVGRWAQPGGGIPAAVAHGRQVVQLLCQRDGRRFEATVP